MGTIFFISRHFSDTLGRKGAHPVSHCNENSLIRLDKTTLNNLDKSWPNKSGVGLEAGALEDSRSEGAEDESGIESAPVGDIRL